MKKSILVFLMSFLLLAGGASLLKAQEQPAPKKDTVNMDTNAKPEFYYQVEDEESTGKSGNSTILIIVVSAVAVVVIAGIAVVVTRKKK